MKKLLILVTLIVAQTTFAQDIAIKKTIEDFFVAFHAKDTIGLKKTFSKELVLQSIAEKKEGAIVSTESVSGFLKSIGSVPANVKLEERLLSWKIEQDGSMAHVWTPYEFYIDGKLSHKGVNSFSLFKAADGWKIIYCVDTRRLP
ncbi:MAG: nuclear transport factor 2 family protein [Flavobacterium sp.]|uniref:nuclear transport factor 2 family protein n=1 Tax=Flavobacterium sp. TaxID=239 RepID=UPI00122B8151|nr:nuclear transport factor 2 family protein [Flavobacterium sp.]RZJ65854.1 MAG: nuclear transport factor 2 family protein [Flavobacterium sp.]